VTVAAVVAVVATAGLRAAASVGGGRTTSSSVLAPSSLLPKGFSLGELLVSDEEAAMLLLRLRVSLRGIAAGVQVCLFSLMATMENDATTVGFSRLEQPPEGWGSAAGRAFESAGLFESTINSKTRDKRVHPRGAPLLAGESKHVSKRACEL
jgi:hypothetical protein